MPKRIARCLFGARWVMLAAVSAVKHLNEKHD